MSNLIIPGDNRITLNLEIYAWRHVHGDIEVFGTWFGRENTPCMVLIPSIRLWRRRYTPCVVRMDNAWIYAEETGDPVAVLEEVVEIAHCLGLDPHSSRDLIRITSAIRSHLGDLLTIPPKPRDTLRVVAEVQATDRETGKAETHAIMDDSANV